MGQLFGNIVSTPLGYVLNFAYQILGSYGLALIAFTLIIKLILLPLGIKQQKSQVNMMKIKPREEAIRKKYANDKDKLNQEIMELYQAENVNPMSGCLPLLIQMPILFGLYGVISKPLTYLMHLPQDVINQIDKLMGTTFTTQTGYYQIAMASEMNSHLTADPNFFSTLEGVFHIDFHMLGLNLAQTPNIKEFGWIWLIPIFSALTAYLSGTIGQKLTGASGGDGQAAGMGKSMMLMMPIMSLWIAFTTPAALGFYWGMSNLLGLAQSFFLSKLYNPQKALEEAKAEISLSNNQKKKQRRMLKLEQDRVLAEEAAELERAQKEESDEQE